MDDSDGSVNLTSATAFKCGNWDNQSGSNIADHANVTWDSGSSTGQLMHMTNRTGATAYYLEVLTGTLADDDTVSDGTNTFDVNGTPDSCALTAHLYDDDGDFTEGGISINGFDLNSTNRVKISPAPGEIHDGTPDSGVTIVHTTTGDFNSIIDVQDTHVVIEGIVFKTTTNHLSTATLRTAIAATSLSDAPIFRNNIIVRVGGTTAATGQSGIAMANNAGATKAFNNIVIGFGRGIFIDNTNLYHLYNNTTKDSGTGIFYGNSVYRAKIKNHLSVDDSTAFSNNIGDSDSTNNLAEDSTAHFGATYDTGTTTATTAGKLVDSGADFVTAGVEVGSVVANTTDSTYTYVTAIDSATTLSVANDIFTSGENFSVYKSYRGSVTCVDKTNNDLHLVSGDTNAIDRGADLGTTDGVNYDIDNYDRDGGGVTWDIGADEYVAAGGARRRNGYLVQ